MKNEELQVKEAVNVGMNIFNVLKNIVLKDEEKIISLEDKKYMSLYIGLLYSNNKISNSINETREYSRIKYRILSNDEYLKLYNEYFVDIFNQIDFTSIENYFKFLASHDSAIIINNILGINPNDVINNSNKQLIKK